MTDLPLLPILPPEDEPGAAIIPADAAPEASLIPAEDAPETALIPAEDAPETTLIPAEDESGITTLNSEFRIPNSESPAFPFSRCALAQAMADAWDDARAALLNGSLARALDDVDLLAAAICRDQTANIASGRFTPDRGVLEAIHRLSGETPVVWCGRRYAGASDLGGSLLQALRGTGTIPVHLDSLLRSGAASVFCEDESQREGLMAIEARYAAPDCFTREQTLLMYMVGFLLSGVAACVIEGETFYTAEDMAAWLVGRSKRSSTAFTHACHRLLDENHLLDPQVEAWLCAIGHRQNVARWQAEIDAGML